MNQNKSHIKYFIRILLSVVLFFAFASFALADNWYVDKNATGSNDGTSWNNAWTKFSNIMWGAGGVTAGDILYISGGSTSKTYSDSLIIRASGTSVNPITITVGVDPSHNGKVLITGQATSNSLISVKGYSWIIISGQSNGDGQRHIEVYDGSGVETTRAVLITGSSNGVKLEYLEIHDIGSVSSDWHTGIAFNLNSQADAVGHEISNNYIYDIIDCIALFRSDSVKPSTYGAIKVHHNTLSCFDDGLTASMGSVDIYNNDIKRAKDLIMGHPDGIQVYSSYYRIHGNYFSGFLDYQGGNAALYIEPDGGNNMEKNGNAPCCYLIYNNVFRETNNNSSTLDAIMLGWSDPDWTSLSDVYILNNTIQGAYESGIVDGWGGTTLDKGDVNNYYIMNNIFYNSTGGTIAWRFNAPSYDTTRIDHGSYGDNVSIVIDNNVYAGTGASIVKYLGIEMNYSTWRSDTGAQKNDVTVDPSLNANLIPDSSTDPVVNSGFDWTSLFTVDFYGATRPVGNWDMGAFEYIGTTPNFPINVRN